MPKKLYSIEQADKILSKYIQDSAQSLRKRLKAAWAKSRPFKVETKSVRHESLLER